MSEKTDDRTLSAIATHVDAARNAARTAYDLIRAAKTMGCSYKTSSRRQPAFLAGRFRISSTGAILVLPSTSATERRCQR